MCANHAFEPNAEVPPFSFVSRFAQGTKITEYEDTHLQLRHVLFKTDTYPSSVD